MPQRKLPKKNGEVIYQRENLEIDLFDTTSNWDIYSNQRQKHW